MRAATVARMTNPTRRPRASASREAKPANVFELALSDIQEITREARYLSYQQLSEFLIQGSEALCRYCRALNLSIPRLR